jgi:hypothetical protein
MRRFCGILCIPGTLAVCALPGTRTASAQIVPTFEGRYVSANYDLSDTDETDSSGDFITPQPDFAPFTDSVEFLGAAISGASATVWSSQSSAITDRFIHAAGGTHVEVAVTEEGAVSKGCSGSVTYLEFSLSRPADFDLRVVVSGSTFGSLRAADDSFVEPLDSTHTTAGSLPAGDYIFEVYTEDCYQISGPGNETHEASYDVALVLQGMNCETAFDLLDLGNPADLVPVGDATVVSPGVLRLTAGAGGEAGAAWRPVKTHVAGGFDTTFVFQVSDNSDGGDGFAFVIQDDGLFAIGDNGSGLGYGASGSTGMARSLAVEFDTFSFAGEFPADHVSVQTHGVGLNSSLDAYSLGHTVLSSSIKDGLRHSCRVVYAPGQLTVYFDGRSVLSVTVNLESINGESILDVNGCARLGFTAGTGGAASTHDILGWALGVPCSDSLQYPDFGSTADLSLVGDASIYSANTLRLTPELQGQHGAAWHRNRVHLAGGFVSQFTFRVSSTPPPADGFAFVIQNEGPDALGGQGHAIGYGTNDVPGITWSLAVEFDTFPGTDLGVQTRGRLPNDSDDIYSLGQAFPPSFADDQLHTCLILYAPGTLDVFLDGAASPVLSVPVDLNDINGESILGATGCAWVGFTAATGGFFSSHDILSWSLGPNCEASPRPGDFDHDCDVDLADFLVFQGCFNGPNRPYAATGCGDADFDSDGDVDLADFLRFQACFNGPNRPPARQ